MPRDCGRCAPTAARSPSFWFHLFIECRIEFLKIILRFGSGGGGGGGGGFGGGCGDFSISPNSNIPPEYEYG